MARFDLGETVICSIEIKDKDGTLRDPATSVTIAIERIQPNFENVLPETDMVRDCVGRYHYDFQTSGEEEGKYRVIYKVVDGTRITITKDDFELVG